MQDGGTSGLWNTDYTPNVQTPFNADQNGNVTDSRNGSTYYATNNNPDQFSVQSPGPDNLKSHVDLTPKFVDTMYAANAGARWLSENHARGQQQDYIQSNQANPLASIPFNDGRSDMVKYGYQQYKLGGNMKYFQQGGQADGQQQQVQQIMQVVMQFLQSFPQEGQQVLQYMQQKLQSGGGGGQQAQQQGAAPDQGQQQQAPPDDGGGGDGQPMARMGMMMGGNRFQMRRNGK